jgi:hypothetical protein
MYGKGYATIIGSITLFLAALLLIVLIWLQGYN